VPTDSLYREGNTHPALAIEFAGPAGMETYRGPRAQHAGEWMDDATWEISWAPAGEHRMGR